jgi:hypothetical protein
VVAFTFFQDRAKAQQSSKKGRVREACMCELQAAARELYVVVGKVAAAIVGGSALQPSAQLVGVCCNALVPLLGASKLVFGRSIERLQPASCAWCLPLRMYAAPVDCAVHKRIPCIAGLPLLQFQQFHAAKQMPMQESQQALLDMEVSHLLLADSTG